MGLPSTPRRIVPSASARLVHVPVTNAAVAEHRDLAGADCVRELRRIAEDVTVSCVDDASTELYDDVGGGDDLAVPVCCTTPSMIRT